MKNKLVIIEAPGKKHSFEKYLPKEYEVVATKGHVLDLPEKKLGIDVDNNFLPEFVVMPDKKDILSYIQKRSDEVDEIILFTDKDYEGHGISYNIYNSLKDKNKKKCFRAISSSITKASIEDAIKNKFSISDIQNKYNAYVSRRILDRLCGYKTSFITKQATGGISAGRCQSACLRIISEREKEIINFKPEVYWPIEAEVIVNKGEVVKAVIKLPKPLEIKTQDKAQKIIDSFKNNTVKVSDFDKKDFMSAPPAPFTTSTLQQAASTYLGFSPDKTMKTAQSLYESSVQTYHRTDSTNIIPEEIDKIVAKIEADYGKNYLPAKPNVHLTKQANAQEAHEAIRPTDITRSQYLSGTTDEAKLYELIWKRTVASQMLPAKYLKTSAEFKVDKDDYILSSNGSKQLFAGWRKCWDYSATDDKYLPELVVGDIVKIKDILTERKETQPPSRYSEASLVREMEKLSIGRPATYASIIKTIKERKYVEKAGSSLKATDLGINVSDFLIKSNFCFVDLSFTGKMEDELDEIADDKLKKEELLGKFWKRLSEDLKNAKSAKDQINLTEFDCPLCSKKLVKKHGKFGDFFACSEYPTCKYSANIGDDGKPKEKERKKEKVYSEHSCPKCKSKMIERTGKYGKFFGCEKYPKCNGMRKEDGSEVVRKPKFNKFNKFNKFKKKKEDEKE